jgi:hypothetical protein
MLSNAKSFSWVGVGAVLVAGLVGCQPQADVDAIREALPQASAIQVRVPGASAAMAPATGAGGVATRVDALLGQTADFYRLTRGVSVDLNLGAAHVLILVRTIVSFPVTSIDGDTYVWGPWSDALNPSEYRLAVREPAAGEYAWSLEGRRKADAGAAFQPVVAGVARPGQPLRGSGQFTMDFDTAEALDPAGNDGQGRLDVDYDLEGSPRQVIMDYARLETPPGGAPSLTTFHYEYREQDGGAGDFVFTVHGDLDDNGSAWELADIRSRWLATGAGRSDVRLTGGDLGNLTVTGSECWDTSFGRVYWTDSAGWQATEGDVADCAFATPAMP